MQLVLERRSYSATEILNMARERGVKGKYVKSFKDGQILVEYDCTFPDSEGTTFNTPWRIRSTPESQTL